MAIIDPDGLFSGERLAACSDLAQLYWPRLFLAANSCGRLELSYKPLVSRVFGNFRKIPKPSEIWEVFRDFEAHFLAVLYEAEDGSWWCQFITSEKFLPKYKKTRDNISPAPPAEKMQASRKGYIEWKRSNSFSNESFQKTSEGFGNFPMDREGVGVGVGIGKRSSLPPKRATRIPEDFAPNLEHQRIAAELGIDLAFETERFRDHWRAKSGKDATKVDWDATLRNWLRNAVNYGKSNGNGANGHGKLSKYEQMRRDDDELFGPAAGGAGVN